MKRFTRQLFKPFKTLDQLLNALKSLISFKLWLKLSPTLINILKVLWRSYWRLALFMLLMHQVCHFLSQFWILVLWCTIMNPSILLPSLWVTSVTWPKTLQIYFLISRFWSLLFRILCSIQFQRFVHPLLKHLVVYPKVLDLKTLTKLCHGCIQCCIRRLFILLREQVLHKVLLRLSQSMASNSSKIQSKLLWTNLRTRSHISESLIEVWWYSLQHAMISSWSTSLSYFP